MLTLDMKWRCLDVGDVHELNVGKPSGVLWVELESWWDVGTGKMQQGIRTIGHKHPHLGLKETLVGVGIGDYVSRSVCFAVTVCEILFYNSLETI